MRQIILQAQPRKILGKRVKQLRRQGLLPGNIYGDKIKSLAVQVRQTQFEKTLQQTGETELLGLHLQGEDEPRPVLISEVQLDPVRNSPLHVDFYQVDLSEKINAAVPLEFVNHEKAHPAGVVLELLDEIEVKTFPNQIPSEVKVDLAKLQQTNEVIKVKDLSLPQGVEILTPGDEPVAKLNPLEETLEEEAEREEAETQTADYPDESETETETTPTQETS